LFWAQKILNACWGFLHFKKCRFPACRQAGIPVLGTKNPQRMLGIFTF
jgi:hypothetical protein